MNIKSTFIMTAAMIVTSAIAIGITSLPSQSAQAVAQQYCFQGSVFTGPATTTTAFACFDSKKECQQQREVWLRDAAVYDKSAGPCSKK